MSRSQVCSNRPETLLIQNTVFKLRVRFCKPVYKSWEYSEDVIKA